MIPTHSGYKVVFASKSYSSCAQSQNKNKGYNKGKLHGIFDMRSKLQFMQIRKILIYISRLCLFVHSLDITH